MGAVSKIVGLCANLLGPESVVRDEVRAAQVASAMARRDDGARVELL